VANDSSKRGERKWGDGAGNKTGRGGAQTNITGNPKNNEKKGLRNKTQAGNGSGRPTPNKHLKDSVENPERERGGRGKDLDSSSWGGKAEKGKTPENILHQGKTSR